MARMWSQFLATLFVGAVSVSGQPPPGVRFMAITQNVSGAGEAIKINISSWSTDAQKEQMIAAWTLANARPADAASAEGRGGRGGGRGGRGGGRGGRGAAPAADLPADPD